MMNKGEYHFYKATFEEFGRKLLEEFKEHYEAGLDLEVDTKHDEDTIIKAATKCFILYVKAKQ